MQAASANWLKAHMRALWMTAKGKNAKATGIDMGSARLNQVERIVIMLDNYNTEKKVRISIKVDGAQLFGFSNNWNNTKEIDVSAYVKMPLIIGKPIMLCLKIREVNGITTTNGEMKDFEEGLTLLVTEKKKVQ